MDNFMLQFLMQKLGIMYPSFLGYFLFFRPPYLFVVGGVEVC